MATSGDARIRVAVVQGAPLYRGVLAAVLRNEEDLEVVAEVPTWQELRALAVPPEVTVLDLDSADETPLTTAAAVRDVVPGARVLVLLGADRHDMLAGLGPEDLRRVGFVTRHASLDHLLSALRSLAAGAAVLDPELVAASLIRPENPLTERERDVLALAAQGMPADDIARKLFVSAGTVRNCLSRIVAKTGADGRSDAISRARKAGWL